MQQLKLIKINFNIGFVIKLVPLRLFGNIQINETPLTDEEERRSLVATLRKSHRQSVRQSARNVADHNKRESQRISGRLSRGANFDRAPGGRGSYTHGNH
jgi:hypothetical protein